MSDNEQRLLVTFEARLNKYERDLERAKGKSRTNFQAIKREAETSAKGIDKAMSGAFGMLGTFGKGVAGGALGALLGGTSLTAIISNTRQVAANIANIGNEAKRAGLSTKSFQELKHVADQNRIAVDSLTDGMKELSLRADEFISTGKGSGAEAFQRLGYSADQLRRKLADPSALLVEIIGKLERFDKAARIRIADEIFGGTGGERFVELIDRGADSIRNTIKEANDLGLVMDDKLIQRADEFDRKWGAASASMVARFKAGLLLLATDVDDFLDRFNKIEEQTTRNVQSALVDVYEKLAEAKAELADLELDKGIFPGDASIDLNIGRQKQQIAELSNEALRLRDTLDRRNGYSENFIHRTRQDAMGAKPPLDRLTNSLAGTGKAAHDAVSGLQSYGEAIRALQNEVPELAASLRDLDTKTKIEAIYGKAVSEARTMGEVYFANELRGEALKSANVKSATDDPSRYLSSVLASGKSAEHITGMADAFASKLAKALASMPDELKGQITINSGYRSVQRQQELWLAALKKYGSPEAARKWVAPPGSSQHNKGNAADLGYKSDEARQWMHQNAGSFGLTFPLKNENWHIEDSEARSQQVTVEIEKLTEAATRQSEAYSQITSSAREYISTQGTEQQALGMTAQQAASFRYEQEMLNQAQRAEIELTPQRRQEIAALARGMAAAETSTEAFRLKQEQLAETSRFFGQQAVDALSGILTGTMSAEEALQSFLQTLIRATLQAALLGEGPLATLFGGGGTAQAGGGVGGILGTVLSAIFGFAEGGYTGPGGKHEPAGVVHRGEFVMSKAAVEKIGVRNLEAMHKGALRGYSEGGLVGSDPVAGRVQQLDSRTKSGDFAQNIQISAPVTVNGSAGTDAQNADLAKKISRQMEETVRGVVAQEMRAQLRPGNMIGRR